MKAEELRCGTIIVDYEADPNKTIYFRVEEIHKDGVMYRCGSCYTAFESLQPIPLTEEWLVKFGFNILLTEKESILYRKNSQDVNVHPIGGFTYGVRGVPVVKIKNVHQLQNLYFALTGEELTIPI